MDSDPTWAGCRSSIWSRRSSSTAPSSLKETIGKAVGATKLQSDRKAEKVKGKVENAFEQSEGVPGERA